MIKPNELKIGALTFVGELVGVNVMVRVLGTGPEGKRPMLGTLPMQLHEWTSLRTWCELFAISDRTVLDLRREVEQWREFAELFKSSNGELGTVLDKVIEQRNAMRAGLHRYKPIRDLFASWQFDGLDVQDLTKHGLGERVIAALSAVEIAEKEAVGKTASTDDESRCAVCGWTLVEDVDRGCVRGDCAKRPRPDRLYAPERAAREYEAMLRGEYRQEPSHG